MAGAPRRSRVYGAVGINKLLRQLPDEAQARIRTELYRAGPEIAARMQGRAPYRTGALRAGISFKVYDKTARLVVGMTGTKRQRSKLFYARIQEFGRKAQVVTVTRAGTYGRALAAGLKVRAGKYHRAAIEAGIRGAYEMHVRAMPGKRFVTGRMPDLRRIMRANLQGIWKRALDRVSKGGE